MTDNVKSITIIGGGLVGSLCACFLAKRGYRIKLYESREDLRKAKHQRGRSINLALSHRGRRALRSVGLEDEVLQNAIPMKGRLLHDISGATKSVIYDEHTNQCIYSVSRNLLNGILLTAAEKFPNVEVFFQSKLINISVREGTCIISNMATNETFEVQSDLIIGADGAFSKVRRFLQQIPLFQFSQTYIDHGYLELSIPPCRGYLMTSNHLHIWPRGEFMMIALPNKDDSWTVTLFMSFRRFEELDDKEKMRKFFESTFPDAIELIGEEELEKQFFAAKPSHLVSIKCSPYHFQDRALVIGDAAHAMVPFYGQGMNCGFEDCTLLDELFETHADNFKVILEKFSSLRKDDAHAICDLAMYNFIEMRDLVTKPSFYVRKVLDNILFKMFPSTWIPLYNSVSFSSIRYTVCMNNRKWQNKIIITGLLIFFLVLSILFFLWRKF
ncbi:hypothetical protein HHI36_013306 [Cryptolaemus montrouzieri]|uniref:Kynurenine 3-monooxygenase n=1 Tax=Cryptolaemus montrouzieri TaxID=559131 RepID=A0ABD2NH03_9CUCU